MRVKKAIEKLQEVGLYAKYHENSKGVRGGSHYHMSRLGRFVYGSFFITPRDNKKYDCEWYVETDIINSPQKHIITNITMTKAVEIIIENVKPGVNTFDKVPDPIPGPCYY